MIARSLARAGKTVVVDILISLCLKRVAIQFAWPDSTCALSGQGGLELDCKGELELPGQ
jgi:hypothetical protein